MAANPSSELPSSPFPLAERAPAVHDAGRGVLELPGGRLVVDAGHGGRVVEFSCGGVAALPAAPTGPGIDPEMFGSTLWLSPQRWPWPPYDTASIHHVDRAAYALEVGDGVLTLRGPSGATHGYLPQVRVEKRLSARARDGVVALSYDLVNDGDVPTDVSPWEVTRTRAAGLSFFPTGEPVDLGRPEMFDALPLVEAHGASWFAFTPHEARDRIVTADGREGWLAQLIDGHVFVKSFTDVTPAELAPGDGELQLYTHPTGAYLELEQRGAWAPLAPGERRRWEVRWSLAPMAHRAEPSPELLSAVRALVASMRAP